jgi:CheY-like chemotaxis protein
MKMRVLVVDDDLDLIEIFGAVLRDAGHDVRTATSGEEGLRALRSAPLPDVVVLDVDMPPGMSGPEMAHQMLLHDAGEDRVPVILMSGNPDLPAIAKRMGTPYWLSKPGSIGAFLQILERARLDRVAPSSA